MTTRKLKHYFLERTVQVVSDLPLAQVLQSKEAIGRIAQWVVEIGQDELNSSLGERLSLKHSQILLMNGLIRAFESLMICLIIVKSANSSRSKLRSMRTLFYPSISLGLLRYGEYTSSVFFQGLHEISGFYSSASIHSLSGWRQPQWQT
jgi:hypothetical protein